MTDPEAIAQLQTLKDMLDRLLPELATERPDLAPLLAMTLKPRQYVSKVLDNCLNKLTDNE